MAINEWDPIGLFPMAPEDEYMNEIIKIMEYLDAVRDITEEKLAIKINQIFIASFGDDVYAEDIKGCLNVARKIINSQAYQIVRQDTCYEADKGLDEENEKI